LPDEFGIVVVGKDDAAAGECVADLVDGKVSEGTAGRQ